MTSAFFKMATLLVWAFVWPASLDCAPDYQVSGVVIDSQSNTPIAHARVSLAPATARDQKTEQVTNADGRFSFPVSQPGKYTLRMIKPGYPSQANRQAVLGGVSSAIVVRDDQDTSHIVFLAKRGGAITGQIKDDDSDPVPNALVAIFQASVVGGERKIVARGQTRANASGEFRISHLWPATYYVCAMGRPWFADSLLQLNQMQESTHQAIIATQLQAAAARTRPKTDDDEDADDSEPALQEFSSDPAFRGTAFVSTCYPRAQTVEEAGLVRVEAGVETPIAISLSLAKGVSVKGSVSLPGTMSDGHAYLHKKIHDQYMLFLQEWVTKKGGFQFKNVPPGSYEIVAASQSSAGESSWNIRQPIEVGSSDMEIALRPPPMGSVSGRIAFDGEPPALTKTVYVSLRYEKGNAHGAEVDNRGNFFLKRLAAGRYEVTVTGLKDYMAAYLAAPAGEHLPLTIDITSGETVRRDVILTRAASAIEGTVEKAGSPQIGAFVLLMPKDASSKWAYRADQTDSDGSFSLTTIPTGDYFLIALDSGEDIAYRDPKVAAILTKLAKPIHIEPSDHIEMKLEKTDKPPIPNP